MNQFLHNLTYHRLHFSIVFLLHEKIKEWNTVYVLHEPTPPVPWLASRDIIHSTGVTTDPETGKLLYKWRRQVTLFLHFAIPPSKSDSRKWSSPTQSWLIARRPRNEMLTTFWQIKTCLFKWDRTVCNAYLIGGGRGGGSSNVFYLNVLHILKEVHFRITVVSELYQVFKFRLIWKGLN